jgi:hypothetical protein
MHVTISTLNDERKFEAHKIEYEAGTIVIFTDKKNCYAYERFFPGDNVFIEIDKELSLSDVFENE